MKFIIISTILILFSFLTCSQKSSKDTRKNKDQDSLLTIDRQLLKNSLFCYCLYHFDSAYDDKLNDGSASFYLQLTWYDPNIFGSKKYTNIAKNYLYNNYKDFDNHSFIVARCLDFYNSKYLDSAVKTFDSDTMRAFHK